MKYLISEKRIKKNGKIPVILVIQLKKLIDETMDIFNQGNVRVTVVEIKNKITHPKKVENHHKNFVWFQISGIQQLPYLCERQNDIDHA